MSLALAKKETALLNSDFVISCDGGVRDMGNLGPEFYFLTIPNGYFSVFWLKV